MNSIKIVPEAYMEYEGREVLYISCKATNEDVVKAYARERTKTGQIPVYKLDKDKNVLAYYKSITEAARANGIDQSNLTRVVDKDNLSAGGYKYIRANKKETK